MDRSGILVATAMFFLIPTGCERPEPATAEQLRTRASFELACPEDQLQVVRLDAATGGVVGCGHRVLYTETCSSTSGCTWSLARELPVAGRTPMPAPAPSTDLPRSSPYARDDPGF